MLAASNGCMRLDNESRIGVDDADAASDQNKGLPTPQEPPKELRLFEVMLLLKSSNPATRAQRLRCVRS